ncbi:hypothetical protein F9K85_21635 [Brucella tritici]|nr:hypothetical protein F9K85_21635 [Brucella tritici]
MAHSSLRCVGDNSTPSHAGTKHLVDLLIPTFAQRSYPRDANVGIRPIVRPGASGRPNDNQGRCLQCLLPCRHCADRSAHFRP